MVWQPQKNYFLYFKNKVQAIQKTSNIFKWYILQTNDKYKNVLCKKQFFCFEN
jgi:hypothetical protein